MKRLHTKDNKIKYFSLNRIMSAMRLEEIYEPEEKFSLEAYVKESFGILSLGDVGDVEIFVTEPMASYVSERRWHETQKINRTPQGITLKIRVRVNDELARWILSLGPAARVVAPENLQTMVSQAADEIIKGYKSPKTA